eukprot:4701874-Pleurochrysis_carterae.AAC.2
MPSGCVSTAHHSQGGSLDVSVALDSLLARTSHQSYNGGCSVSTRQQPLAREGFRYYLSRGTLLARCSSCAGGPRASPGGSFGCHAPFS